jgi:hypothetical protein
MEMAREAARELLFIGRHGKELLVSAEFIN